VDRDRFLRDLCSGKDVLHLGCVDSGLTAERIEKGELLHGALANVARGLWGVDLDESGVRVLTDLGHGNIFVGDVERLSEVRGLEGLKFDVIVAGEIVEHLASPGLFLDGCKPLLASGGCLALTTPNALALVNAMLVPLRREAIHPDHTLAFTPTSLRRLLEQRGYSVGTLAVCRSGSFLDWKKGSALARLARIGFNMLQVVAVAPAIRAWHYWAEGLIVVACPNEGGRP
jgi:SAM-dependent methyltransferase